MENAAVLMISELIDAAQAVASVSSLYSSTSRLIPHSSSKSDHGTPQSPPPFADSDHNPKVLTPLNQPSILIGTIVLPSQTLKCPNRHCLQFSDDSRTICCDVIGLEVGAIGKKIRVLTWNFIPLEHGGGFLEIIEWKFLDSGNSLSRCSRFDSFPLVSSSHPAKDVDSKSKYRAYGVVESVSPMSAVPCSTSFSNKDTGYVISRGFLVRILACKCKLCSSKEHNLNSEDSDHSFTEPVFIYFCGSTACWHSVMTKLVRCVVLLSKMKKKMVFVSKENSQLMFVATENSILQLPGLSKKWLGFTKTAIKGTGECGAYTGIVKGVYMEGMLVELDVEVWLLLTDKIISRPHSLRVGALISVRNVHFVNPKFSWGTMLILGACFKTSITVESFSPLEAGGLIVSHSECVLHEFIKSLSFPARFWTLLIISCFQKFGGILTEKEIFGSNHKKGLARIYAESRIPSQMFQARHGLFTEFCLHESSGCNSTPSDCNLKLVIPVSSFVQHNNIILNELLLGIEKDHNVSGHRNHSIHPSSVWKTCGRSSRKTFLSYDIGIVLLGSLKISCSSGRMQLLDRNGSIDIMVPNFPINWRSSNIYEVIFEPQTTFHLLKVTDYCLTIDGTPELMALLQSTRKSFACRNVFNCAPATIDNTLPMFISFCLSAVGCRNILLYLSLDWKDDVKELEGGKFHLFWVTHKFPVLQNFQGNRMKSKSSCMFVEAVILPWDLIYPVKERKMVPAESHRSRTLRGNPSSKRCRTLDATSGKLLSTLMNGLEYDSHANVYHGIPCLMTIKNADHHSWVTSGILFDAKVNQKVETNKELRSKKVLLEFKSEEFENYNCLQIGGCYMTKHNIEDPFCSFARSSRFDNDKIPFSQETRVWGVDLSFDEVLTCDRSADYCPSVSDFPSSSNEGLSVELMERRNLSSSSRFHSAVSLHLAYDAKRLFAAYLKDLGEDLMVKVGETFNVSSQDWCAMTIHSLPSGTNVSNGLYPEGNLVSLSGDVVAINSHKHCDDVPSSCCVHVLINHQTVKVIGSLNRHTYLSGFGPGVNVTFYRILRFGRENFFLLSPVSFITINSLKAADDPCTEKCSDIPAACVCDATSQENLSAGLICDLVSRFKDNEPISFFCKVIGVHVVILQNGSDSLSEPKPGSQFNINIPLAGFVVDDGSSLCCCWAEGKRASTLLRLHEELPQRAIDDCSWIKKEDTWSTIIYHLERIVKKHKRIVVKNIGSLVDSVFQDLTISVSSYDTITSSEEKFLKLLMLNASNGPIWRVDGRKMESDGMRKMEKEEGVELGMKKAKMENASYAWAMLVVEADPLAEARRLLLQPLFTS